MNQSLFRFCDGRVVAGMLMDVLPLPAGADSVEARLGDEGPRQLPLSELKAVFILRPAEIGGPPPLESLKVAVDFFDGETIRGTARGWVPGRPTFLLIPEDNAKVEAILVVASALVGVEIEGGAQRGE